jgi:hypothetical protein
MVVGLLGFKYPFECFLVLTSDQSGRSWTGRLITSITIANAITGDKFAATIGPREFGCENWSVKISLRKLIYRNWPAKIGLRKLVCEN